MNPSKGNAGIDFDRCKRAHPYWLSTIRSYCLPRVPDSGPPLLVSRIATAAAALKQGNLEEFGSTIAALMDMEETKQEGLAASWIHAMRALALAMGGRLHEARRCSALSLAWPGAPAQWGYNKGVIEVRLGHIAEAVRAFRMAVEIEPSLGQSWAALALIFALARADNDAEEAARMARSLGTTVGNDLVGLSLMQATYRLGKPMEGAFYFAPGDRSSTTAIQNALSGLPAIDSRQLVHSDDGRPIVFVACDNTYLNEHAIPLIWSLAESKSACSVHLHLMNPEGPLEEVRRALPPEGLSPAVVISSEVATMQNRGQQVIYYSCVRFCRLYQLATQNPHRTIVFLDADMLVRKDIATFPGLALPGKEIGLRHCIDDPMWQEISAAAGWIKASPLGIRFLSDVALCILENLARGEARWFLDQFALFVAWDRFAHKHAIHLCDQDYVTDHHYTDDSLIWGAGNDKRADTRYSEFKRYLSAKYRNAG